MVGPTSNQQPPEQWERYLICRLGEILFAVPLLQMRRIEPLRPITRVPRAPQFLRGVIDLHGEIIPVVDLKLRLGLSAEEPYYDEQARLLIVEVEGQPVGMLTDAVVSIRRLDVTAIEPPPPMVADINGVYLTGVIRWEEQLLIILDLSRVLTLEEVEAMQHLSLIHI